MKKRNGFTLIELLAVIVILAVILVISIPRILDVIEESKVNTFKNTAQLIADSAEKKYVTNKLNNIDEEITCENVTKLSSNDYEYCFVKFDEEGKATVTIEGKATVTIEGKGKFDGLVICNGTKENAELKEGDSCSTDAKYFSYEDINGNIDYYDVSVVDQSKCVAYLIEKFNVTSDEATQEANTICSGGPLEDGSYFSYNVSQGFLPESDYETAGLVVNISKKYLSINESKCTSYASTIELDSYYCTDEDGMLELPYFVPKSDYELAGILMDKPRISITGYNIEGGLDVVIPSEIDGKIVVAIADYAFESAPLLSLNNIEYKIQLLDSNSNYDYTISKIGQRRRLGITSVVIPDSVTSIGDYAFYKSNASNPNLTKIINKTGKSFDWGNIINYESGYNFVTGTVVNSVGNVEIVSE